MSRIASAALRRAVQGIVRVPELSASYEKPRAKRKYVRKAKAKQDPPTAPDTGPGDSAMDRTCETDA